MDDKVEIEARVSKSEMLEGLNVVIELKCLVGTNEALLIGGYAGEVGGVPLELAYTPLVFNVTRGEEVDVIPPRNLSPGSVRLSYLKPNIEEFELGFSPWDSQTIRSAEQIDLEVRIHDPNGNGDYVKMPLPIGEWLTELPEPSG